MKLPILLLTLGLLLQGCHEVPYKAAPTASVKATNPVNAEVEAQKKAFDAERAEKAKLDGKILADISSALEVAKTLPADVVSTILKADLTLATGKMEGVTPDPTEVKALLSLHEAYQSGNEAEAQEAYDNASTAGVEASQAVKTATEASDQAVEKLKSAIEALKTDLAASAKANQDAYDKKVKEMNERIQSEEVRDLRIAAFACLAIFGLAAGFGQLAGAKVAWPFLLYSVLCFGMAQLVSQDWFKYAEMAAIILSITIAGVWVYYHYKAGDLIKATTQKATELTTVVKNVVPVLDDAYNAASESEKTLLDKLIFQPLEKLATNTTYNKTIHDIRSALSSQS